MRDDAGMPRSVGFDLVCVEDVRDGLARHRRRYLERLFSAAEVGALGGDEAPDPSRVAQVVAAKEAAVKALRPDDDPLPWRDIGVLPGRAGGVRLELTGAAARLADARRLERFSVTLSLEGGVAAAIVVAEAHRP